MNTSTIFSIALFTLICSCTAKKDYMLNQKFNDTNFINNDKILIPSGEAKKVVVKKDNVKYILGLSSQNDIIYISTSDSLFVMNEIKVGTSYNEIKNKIGGLDFIPGWGYYTKINEEWYVGFDFKALPVDSSKVLWFFKYDFENEDANIKNKELLEKLGNVQN